MGPVNGANANELEFSLRDQKRTLACKDGTTSIVAWSNISKQVPIPAWNTWAIVVDVTERARSGQKRARAEEELRNHRDHIWRE